MITPIPYNAGAVLCESPSLAAVGKWFADFARRYGAEILSATYQHLFLVGLSLAIALLVALPMGILLTRLVRTKLRFLSSIFMGAAGIVQTIPSLAMIAFGVTLLLLLKGVLPFDISAIGTFPAVVALVLYALLPILRNTYTGIRQVDQSVIEVARGMGMKNMQILGSIELPLALPFIMAGIRISTVWTIGVAALGGLIGAGGLGDLIMNGLKNYDIMYLLAGSIPASLMAILAEWLLGRVENWLTPPGVQETAT